MLCMCTNIYIYIYIYIYIQYVGVLPVTLFYPQGKVICLCVQNKSFVFTDVTLWLYILYFLSVCTHNTVEMHI